MKWINETVTTLRLSINEMLDSMEDIGKSVDASEKEASKVEWNSEEETVTTEKRADGTVVTTKKIVRRIRR